MWATCLSVMPLPGLVIVWIVRLSLQVLSARLPGCRFIRPICPPAHRSSVYLSCLVAFIVDSLSESSLCYAARLVPITIWLYNVPSCLRRVVLNRRLPWDFLGMSVPAPSVRPPISSGCASIHTSSGHLLTHLLVRPSICFVRPFVCPSVHLRTVITFALPTRCPEPCWAYPPLPHRTLTSPLTIPALPTITKRQRRPADNSSRLAIGAHLVVVVCASRD